MQPSNSAQRLLDFAGSMVDMAFLSFPAILFPFADGRKLTAEAYQQDLLFYIDNGYCDHPRTFFEFPQSTPTASVVASKPYGDGVMETITWQSGYTPKNPNLRPHWDQFKANQTACLVRWHHGKPQNKTVLCLHGFMLGEPKQAARMFQVRALFNQGLDVALFVAPLHWRRGSKKPTARGAFLQPNDACITAEAIGQSMHDLQAAFMILQDLGAGPIGLVGASMGAYSAALYSCLSDAPVFCALMVPAVKFINPLEHRLLRKFSGMPDHILAKALRVWDFTAPLGMTPMISEEKILIVASRGDRLCPMEYTRQLAARWDKARSIFLTGGHWLIFNRKERGRAWYGLLAECGFVAPRVASAPRG